MNARSTTDTSPPASGWTDTDVSVRLRRGAGGAIRVDGVLCSAPVWFRWDGMTLWMVGSGASPVGEDDIRVRVDVGPGLDVAVRSVAATVVYAARGAGTRWTTEICVAEGAVLRWQPEPLILTEDARHSARTRISAASNADVLLDEVVVLGRCGESGGTLCSTLDVWADDTQVLLTTTDTSTPGFGGPGGTNGASVLANRLRMAPGIAEPASSPTAVHDGVVLEPTAECRLAVVASDGVDAARGSIRTLLSE